MDNIEITEQTLNKFRDDMVRSIRIAMADETKKRTARFEEIIQEQNKDNIAAAQNIRSAVIQLSEKMKKAPSAEPSDLTREPELADSNLVRLLNTFEKAMGNAGETLAKGNAEEISKYMEKLYEYLNESNSNLSETVGNRFNDSITSFSSLLESLTETLVEKNRLAITEVQSENNLEIQQLAERMTVLAQEERDYNEKSVKNGQVMAENVQRLIDNNAELSNTVRQHISDGADKIEHIMQEQLRLMLEQNAELERNNANEFQKAMEDYRLRFVNASAEAIAAVQSDMLSKMEKTQEQISSLAAFMQEFIEVNKNAEIENQRKNEELRSIVAEYSKEMTGKINEIYTVIGDIKTLIAEDHAEIKKEIKSMSDNIYQVMDEIKESISGSDNDDVSIKDMLESSNSEINSSIKKSLHNYNEELGKFSASLETIHKSVEELSRQTANNTESYNAALKTITENQKKARELSVSDYELLKKWVSK